MTWTLGLLGKLLMNGKGYDVEVLLMKKSDEEEDDKQVASFTNPLEV